MGTSCSSAQSMDFAPADGAAVGQAWVPQHGGIILDHNMVSVPKLKLAAMQSSPQKLRMDSARSALALSSAREWLLDVLPSTKGSQSHRRADLTGRTSASELPGVTKVLEFA